MNKLHLGLYYTDTNGARVACFQLLNSEMRAVATANFSGEKLRDYLSLPSLSELEVAIFHAACRNAILSSVNWDALVAETEETHQSWIAQRNVLP